MKAPRAKEWLPAAAALALALLRDAAGPGPLCGVLPAAPGWIAPGTPAGLAVGVALLAYWTFAACRVGRAAARAVNPGSGRAGLVLWTFLYAYLFVLLSVLAAGALGLISAAALTLAAAAAIVVTAAREGGGGDRRAEKTLKGTGGRGSESFLSGGSAGGGVSGETGGPDAARSPSDAAAAGIVPFVRGHPLAALAVAAAAGLVLVNAAWAFILPPFANDDLTYHLVFPVEWMQSGSLAMRAVPFGNHSPPYYPMNTEMFYIWLMLPLRAAFHVNAAQVLFLAGSVLSLYEIFRKCGASVRAAAAAAALFSFSPVAAAELGKAYVDVAFCCFFLVSVNAALAFGRSPSAGRALQFAAALGIFAGTKIPGILFAGLVVLPLFAVLCIGAARRRAAGEWAAPGGGGGEEKAPHPAGSRPGLAGPGAASHLSLGRTVLAALGLGVPLFCAAGGWWYLRNLFVTGDPVFPLTVKLFGTTLFQGAYDRAALPSSRLETLLDLFTPPFWILIGTGAVWTALAAFFGRGLRGEARRALLAGLFLPALLALVFRLLLPFDYARFVLVIAGLAGGLLLVPLDSRMGGAGREGGGAGSLFPAGRAAAALVLVAAAASFFAPGQREKLLLPLSEARLISSWPVWSCFALVLLSALTAAAVAAVRLPERNKGLCAALAIPLVFCSFSAGRTIADPRGIFFTSSFKKSREPYIFLDENYSGVTVAVAGTTRSFLLYGRDLENRVLYANVNRCRGWLFHDYVRRFGGDREAAAKDRNGVVFYRTHPNYRAWLANLEGAGADLLVVERLAPWNLVKGYARDGDGFPLEAIWADRHGDTFRRVYSSPLVRIYEIRRVRGREPG